MNVDTTYSVLSLCSGIGGLDLGACRALGGRVVAYCERDPYAATVLLERMESAELEPAPVWVGDLRDLDARPLAGVDVVCAGYPCQPFSQAGKRLGEEDERFIWDEVARVIREVRPKYVCLENVSGHLQLGFDRVLGDLHELGFDAEWSLFRAADVGAPHLRRRVFVLAYASSATVHLEQGGRGPEGPTRLESGGEGAPNPGGHGAKRALAHAESDRLNHYGVQAPHEGGAELDYRGRWAPEPNVGRVAHGISARVDRLRCLGNAVVPQQAEVAFRSLWHRASTQRQHPRESR
jgi:DNA (cytosine-5)-methyltransferase 1